MITTLIIYIIVLLIFFRAAYELKRDEKFSYAWSIPLSIAWPLTIIFFGRKAYKKRKHAHRL